MRLRPVADRHRPDQVRVQVRAHRARRGQDVRVRGAASTRAAGGRGRRVPRCGRDTPEMRPRCTLWLIDGRARPRSHLAVIYISAIYLGPTGGRARPRSHLAETYLGHISRSYRWESSTEITLKGIYDTEWSPWPTIFTYYELNARINVSSITPSAGDPWRYFLRYSPRWRRD